MATHAIALGVLCLNRFVSVKSTAGFYHYAGAIALDLAWNCHGN
ncbi:hypothetical protein N7V09_18920 [Shewanella seohaensis]|nr:hypothetical protein [Shewanella seohaensis]UXM81727.1 hypothetical protein N7V09_18920 [Shewanella seohaensis]